MTKHTPLALVLATAGLLSACAGAPIDFRARSVNDRALVDLTKGERISAQALSFQLLYVIPIDVNTRHANAYKALLNRAGDRLLADIKVTESWRYALIGTQYITTIEATAYPRVSSPGAK